MNSIALVLSLALTSHPGFVKDTHNEVHPHVKAVYGDYTFGSYFNSGSEVSFYGSYTYDFGTNSSFEFGAVTGYQDNTGTPVAPFIRLNHHVGDWTLFASPTAEKHRNKMEPRVLLGLEYSFRVN